MGKAVGSNLRHGKVSGLSKSKNLAGGKGSHKEVTRK